MAGPVETKIPKRKYKVLTIIAIFVSVVVSILSVWYMIHVFSEDSGENMKCNGAFIELDEENPAPIHETVMERQPTELNEDSDAESEKNPDPTACVNYYFGTIVVSANKDGYTNIREEPNTKSEIVGVLYDEVKSERNVNGVDCEVWENYAKLSGREGNWLQVETNGAEGYVHISQVEIIENGIAVKK